MQQTTSDIRSLSLEELGRQLGAWGQPKYRAEQILDWVHNRLAVQWGEMSNLPKVLREKLSKEFPLEPIQLTTVQGACDSTQKFLWRLKDGRFVESVLIPANPALYGEASDRHTLCVSTQVGCAYGCKFCASGLEGWKRDLRVEEIVEQVLAVERWHRKTCDCEPGKSAGEEKGSDRLVNNLVIMGMGEPLANWDNLMKALTILNAPWGRQIGARKITISTSGLAPEIRRLADQSMQVRLAISLHGATDQVREKIMPINRKYPLAELLSACEYYQTHKGRMITLEYILIAGVNDAQSEVPALAALARRLHAKVNLIPYNQVEGLPWERPSEAAQDAFCRALEAKKVSVTLRREKGHEIDAACGQLRLRAERGVASAGTPALE